MNSTKNQCGYKVSPKAFPPPGALGRSAATVGHRGDVHFRESRLQEGRGCGGMGPGGLCGAHPESPSHPGVSRTSTSDSSLILARKEDSY